MADAITAVATLAAVLVAVVAWSTSVSMLRSSYRPVLRPVPLRERQDGRLWPGELLLKNIGTGPALSVMMFVHPTTEQSPVLAEVDLVEPLGPSSEQDELTRIGRARLEFRRGQELKELQAYRVLYQDLGGGWHETRFSVQHNQFVVSFFGRKRWWHRGRGIPEKARRESHVVSAFEWT